MSCGFVETCTYSYSCLGTFLLSDEVSKAKGPCLSSPPYEKVMFWLTNVPIFNIEPVSILRTKADWAIALLFNVGWVNMWFIQENLLCPENKLERKWSSRKFFSRISISPNHYPRRSIMWFSHAFPIFHLVIVWSLLWLAPKREKVRVSPSQQDKWFNISTLQIICSSSPVQSALDIGRRWWWW